MTRISTDAAGCKSVACRPAREENGKTPCPARRLLCPSIGAWFRPAPAANWIKILYDGRLSQLFVPYHSGSPRFYDVNYGLHPVQLSTDDCVPPVRAAYSGAHHIIRDEDTTAGGTAGMTLTMYDLYQLKPFNLWSQTPFCDPPSQCN